MIKLGCVSVRGNGVALACPADTERELINVFKLRDMSTVTERTDFQGFIRKLSF